MHFTALTTAQRETFRRTLKEHVGHQYKRVDDFALDVGVSRMTVYRWFNGRAFPKVDQLLSICASLAVSPEELVAGLALPEIPVEFKAVSIYCRSEEQGRGRVAFQMRVVFDSRPDAEEAILKIRQALGSEVWSRLPKSAHFKL